MGGGIALLTALLLLEDDPARLSAMALLAPAAYRQPLPFFIRTAARPWLGPMALRMLPASFIIRAGLRRAYHDPTAITQAQVEAYAHPLRSRHGRHALSRMARQLIPPDLDALVARYREITVPSLLIWGAYDSVVPVRLGKRLAEELPRASLEMLPHCGHMPQEEDPEESLRIFRRFLDHPNDVTRPGP
jgi:pimeloyl-ACP methyl ester carboxylesterase